MYACRVLRGERAFFMAIAFRVEYAHIIISRIFTFDTDDREILRSKKMIDHDELESIDPYRSTGNFSYMKQNGATAQVRVQYSFCTSKK